MNNKTREVINLIREIANGYIERNHGDREKAIADANYDYEVITLSKPFSKSIVNMIISTISQC